MLHNQNMLIGKKFTRLLVLKQDKSKHGRTYWKCLCDCGTICVAQGKALRNKEKQSCGCLRRDRATANAAILSENNRLPHGEAGFNLLYATYRCGAEHRAHVFELTKPEFKILTSGLCVYCGAEPKQRSGNPESGFYIYNGVDRKNNEIGYTSENCVSCCGKCNLMKRLMSPDEFIFACRSVVQHFDLKKAA